MLGYTEKIHVTLNIQWYPLESLQLTNLYIYAISKLVND